MRVFLAGAPVFVVACAAIAGLDDPGEPSPPAGLDAAVDAEPVGADAPSSADTSTTADALADAGDDAPSRPPLCDENGLVARWTLDEGSGGIAHDCTSGRHDGVITGAQWVAGQVGPGALRFTGDSVDVGNPDAFKITAAITLTAWISPTSGTTGSGRIVSKSSQSDRGWEINLEGGTKLEFKIATGTTSYSQLSTDITTGEWHHVAGVYAPGAQMRLYLDGTERTSLSPAPGSQRDTPFNVLIGAHPGETCCRFPGDIDDVRIYTRALSTSEVQAVMTAQ